MTPVAGVVLLAVQHDVLRSRCRVDAAAAVRDVRNALFLVDDQRIDDIQVLGLGLQHEMRRIVAIKAAIVHVHVGIAADPVAATDRR